MSSLVNWFSPLDNESPSIKGRSFDLKTGNLTFSLLSLNYFFLQEKKDFHVHCLKDKFSQRKFTINIWTRQASFLRILLSTRLRSFPASQNKEIILILPTGIPLRMMSHWKMPRKNDLGWSVKFTVPFFCRITQLFQDTKFLKNMKKFPGIDFIINVFHKRNYRVVLNEDNFFSEIFSRKHVSRIFFLGCT